MQGYAAGMGRRRSVAFKDNGFWIERQQEAETLIFKYGRNKMSDNKRLNNYDNLPLVLDVADIRRIMGISRVSAYELVHTPGFPAFRSGRLIKVSKKAFFDWMEKGTETLPKDNK